MPGRRRGSAPAAGRACRGLVRISGCSITGSSAGSSSSRSVKPATRRQRRQRRAVPSGDHRQVGQGEGETAHRQPIGVAVAWSWCRVAGKPRLLWSGQCWRDSITGSSSVPLFSRLVKPATERRRRQHLEVPGSNRRQTGQGEGDFLHMGLALYVFRAVEHCRSGGWISDRILGRDALRDVAR